MTTIISGSSPSITFSDSTTQTTAANITAPYTSNGVVYASSTTALATGSALTFDGTNLGLGATPSAFTFPFTSGTLQMAGGFSMAPWSSNAQMYISTNAYYNSGWKYNASSKQAAQYNLGDGGHAWLTSPSGTAGNAITFTTAMTLDSSGTLIIGATAKVSGTTYLSVQGSTASSNIMEQKDTGTSYASGNYYQVYFNSTNGVAGGVAHTAATTVAFNTSSDVRLKKNIVDAPSALDKVVAAQVRSFDWKDDDRHVEYGFIAQELFQHFPEAVGKGDDAAEIESPKSTWQVEYGRLTPMLVKAIQELSTLITAQSATIQSLTARLTALENK